MKPSPHVPTLSGISETEAACGGGGQSLSPRRVPVPHALGTWESQDAVRQVSQGPALHVRRPGGEVKLSTRELSRQRGSPGPRPGGAAAAGPRPAGAPAFRRLPAVAELSADPWAARPGEGGSCLHGSACVLWPHHENGPELRRQIPHLVVQGVNTETMHASPWP